MITKKFWVGSLVVSSLFVACGDKDGNDGKPDECPDGTLECECLEDDECGGALVCESGVCVQPSATGGNTGSGGQDGDGDGDGAATGGNGDGTGGNGDGDGDGDGTGGSGDGDGDGDGDGEGGLGGWTGDGDGEGGLGGLSGDGDGDDVECEDGCALLTVPFSAFDTGTDFEITYLPALDLSSAVVTARVFVEMAGNTGGIQLYAKNGATQSYVSRYSGWTDLGNATSAWMDLSLDLSSLANPDGPFVKSEVVWVGLNVASGASWGGAQLGEVKVYVEDIMFTAGGDDVMFATDLEGMQVNVYNAPVASSTITHYP